jgi:hypothetical protein
LSLPGACSIAWRAGWGTPNEVKQSIEWAETAVPAQLWEDAKASVRSATAANVLAYIND